MAQHLKHAALVSAFQTADSNIKKDKAGNARYGFAASGMPRTPAQMQAVKKAAAVSAANRANKASPTEGVVDKTATGSVGLNKKKGLLGM